MSIIHNCASIDVRAVNGHPPQKRLFMRRSVFGSPASRPKALKRELI